MSINDKPLALRLADCVGGLATAPWTREQVAAELRRLHEVELERDEWRRALTAVMPADFKDWHQNSPTEWPALAAWCLTGARADRDTAPVAWLYTLEYGSKVADTKVSRHQLNYPFGVCGADYLRSNADGTSYVRQVPLYAAQPAAERAHGIGQEGDAA